MSEAFYSRAVTRTSEDRIVRRVRTLEKRLDSVARRPQLPSSAIDDGAVTVTSGGVTTGIIGQQYDGTSAYVSTNGPVPPTPRPPLVVTVVGGLRVTVTGLFEDPQNGYSSPVVAPQDFSRWDVEVSTSPSFPEFADPMAYNSGSVLAASGGQIKVGWPVAGQLVYVRVRARSLSGGRSTPSESVPVSTGAVGLGDLGFDLSSYVASNSVQYGTSLPALPYLGRIGTLYLLQTAAGPPPRYTTYRWTGAAWDALADQSASDALAAAVAAQQAADLKMRPYYQTTAPAYSGPADTAMWWDTDDGNRPYRWNGSAWADNRLGNGAIQPNSLVASTVVATGTITAALLQTVLVLTTAVLAGDPVDEHTRMDSAGLRAFANDEGIPVEVSFFGRGFGVRNPDTGMVTGGITDGGDISGQTLSIVDSDPSFGGTLLSETVWELPWGIVAYGKLPALASPSLSAYTNTELGFLEIGFQAKPGRVYGIFAEPIEMVNATTTGAGQIRLRYTTNGTAPTVASTLMRQWSRTNDMDASWNDSLPSLAIYNGPAAGAAEQTVRVGFSYASASGGSGTAIVRARDAYVWVEDMGPQVPETGDETSMGGTAVTGGGTTPPSGGTTTKQNYTYQGLPTWQRTWAQNNTSVIADNELQQGYGDSSNGHRRSAAGWSNLATLLTGATVTEVAFYLESYWWWNTSGGVLQLGTHGTTTEPAVWPGQASPGQYTYTARSQGKWIYRNDLLAGVKSGAVRGCSLIGVNNATTYYSKFRGDRIYIRVKYTK